MSDAATTAPIVKPRISRDDWIMRGAMLLIALYLLVGIAFPLYALLAKSFQNADGDFIGLTNYITYLTTPALSWSIGNSFKVTLAATVIVMFVAFIYAYALTRSCMPFKSLFKGIALVPILMPSLLPAISLVFLFGNQGIIKEWLFGAELYGPIGIVMGEVFYVFPHIMTSSPLSGSRKKLPEMPCTAGGWPVTIDRLFGFVKLGTTQCPRRSAPFFSAFSRYGICPPAMACSM